jgi:hypothetical protein
MMRAENLRTARLLETAVVLGLGVLGMGRGAWAQPIPGTEFTDQSYDEAMAESIKTHKVLVVYPRGHGLAFDKMDETTWRNPTLAAWIKWHAIAVRIDEHEHTGLMARFQQMVRSAGGDGSVSDFPHVFFYCNGKLAGVYPDPKFQNFLFENPLGLPGGKPDPATFYPKAVQVLFRADLLMDFQRARDPMWSVAHAQDNPEPKAPEVTPLHEHEDADAPAVADPGPGEDALSVLERARAQVSAQEYYDATGRYTWLWERGATLEPSLGPALRCVVLPEMAELAKKREGSRHRLVALRQNLEARQPWWSYTDLLDWIQMSEALGLKSETAEYLAAYTVDDQEQTMMPPSDRAAYSLLERRGEHEDPREIGKDDVDRLRAMASRAKAGGRPRNVDAEEWDHVVALRWRLIGDESCRLYAAFLSRGDANQASEVAKILLEARDDGASRLMLAMTAAAAGLPMNAEQSRWVREAVGMGSSSPALEKRLGAEGAAPATGK